MKSLCWIALTATLLLFGSLSHARGAPSSSFVPRTSHQERATLSNNKAKTGHAGLRRSHRTPRVRPPQ